MGPHFNFQTRPHRASCISSVIVKTLVLVFMEVSAQVSRVYLPVSPIVGTVVFPSDLTLPRYLEELLILQFVQLFILLAWTADV